MKQNFKFRKYDLVKYSNMKLDKTSGVCQYYGNKNKYQETWFSHSRREDKVYAGSNHVPLNL